MVGQNDTVVFAALRERLWSDLDATYDRILDADDRTAAEEARAHLPGLIAGLHTLLEQHVPDAEGHCGHCGGGRWWRRVSVPCQVLLTFQLARQQASTSRPRHRRRTPQE